MMKYMAIKYSTVRRKRLAFFVHKCTGEYGKDIKPGADILSDGRKAQ